MANQRKNNNKMNMNMSRPSMLWLYGLIGAFIIGFVAASLVFSLLQGNGLFTADAKEIGRAHV